MLHVKRRLRGFTGSGSPLGATPNAGEGEWAEPGLQRRQVRARTHTVDARVTQRQQSSAWHGNGTRWHIFHGSFGTEQNTQFLFKTNYKKQCNGTGQDSGMK